MKFKAIDLFCGAGGLSIGLKKSGFRVCLGVDIDEKALKTAFYGAQRSPFCFRTAAFRSQRPPIF